MTTQISRKLTLACATALYMLPLSAMDEPMEIEGSKPSLKRNGNFEGNSSKRQKLIHEMDASNPVAITLSMPELISYIMNSCGDESTKNAFLSMNNYFFNVRDGQYKKLNEKKNYLQWHDDRLSEYALDNFMREFERVVGLGMNLLLPNMAGDIDHKRLQRSHAKIKEAPFFREDSLPKLFTEYVANMINYKYNNALVDQTLWSTINKEFAIIGMQQDPKKYQNETALYFCYLMFNDVLNDNTTPTTPYIWTHYLFKQCTGSLMAHLNKKLWDAKCTEELSRDPKFVDTWKTIIDLDPDVTISQLGHAGHSHSKADKFADAATYFDQYIEMIEAVEGAVPAYAYGSAIWANFNAKDFAKAALYCKKYIEFVETAGEPIEDEGDYMIAALSYAKWGDHDEEVIKYGESWYEMKASDDEELQAEDFEGEEIELLEHMIEAYIRQSNSDRAAFFRDILENLQG